MTCGKGRLKVLRNLKPGLCFVVLVLESVLAARSIRFLRAENEPAKYAHTKCGAHARESRSQTPRSPSWRSGDGIRLSPKWLELDFRRVYLWVPMATVFFQNQCSDAIIFFFSFFFFVLFCRAFGSRRLSSPRSIL